MGLDIGRTLGAVVHEINKVAGGAAAALARSSGGAAARSADPAPKSASALEEQVRNQFERLQTRLLDAYRASGFQATLDAMRESAERLVNEVDKSLTWTREELPDPARWVFDATFNPAAAQAVRACDWTYVNALEPLSHKAGEAPHDLLPDMLIPLPIQLAIHGTGWLVDVAGGDAPWERASELRREAASAALDSAWYERARQDVTL